MQELESSLTVQYIEPTELKPHPFNDEIYEERDDSDLEASIITRGILQPLVITIEKVIISGHRRWKIALKHKIQCPCLIIQSENEKLDIIDHNLYRIKTPRELYYESIMRRTCLEQEARLNLLISPGRGQKGLSNLTNLNRDKTHVRETVAKELDVSNGQLYKIQQIYENGDKIPTAIKQLDNGQITVHRAYKELQKVALKTQPKWVEAPEKRDDLPRELYATNIWVMPNKRPEGYGSAKFRGNCSPIIIDQCLRRYINPSGFEDAKVLDPMVGSGTFIDVAKSLGIRNIFAYDINPIREDVEFGNALDIPLEKESIDLIFCHYPYWNMWIYSDKQDDFSTKEYNDFLELVERSFKEFVRLLKKDSYLCVLIGNKREAGIVDIEADLSKVGQKYFNLWDKIITIVGTPDSHAAYAIDYSLIQMRALHSRWTVQNYDTLLVFRKEVS